MLDSRDFIDVIEKKIRKSVEPEPQVCILCGQPSTAEICPKCEEEFPVKIKGLK